MPKPGARREPHRIHGVMLLVTAATPAARIDELRRRLAGMYRCSAEDIRVEQVDASCQTPSSYVAQRKVWLFADSAVGSMAPDSTTLARDWAEQWFVRNQDAAGRIAPLYQCKLKPQQQRRPGRR